MHRVVDLRRLARRPVGGAVKADIRRVVPQEAQHALGRLLGDRDRRRLAHAPVRVDDRPLLGDEALELRPELRLRWTMQLAVLVQLALAHVVGPYKLGERHGLRGCDRSLLMGSGPLERD